MTTATPRGSFSCWWLMALLALLGVLPFMLLGFFAHPSADDWYMAADTLEKGFWQSNLDFYWGLTGRYFSSALLFANPILLSFTAFKAWSFLLVLALPVSLRWAAGAWFPEASKGWRSALAVLLSVVFLWGMASPAQGFYWGTGSVGYMLPGVLSFCVAALLGRRCLEVDWRPRPALLAALALLAVAITGCTEVAMALFLAHVTALNAIFFWRHRRVSCPLLVVLMATCLGVALVVLTPGNANRQTWYSNEIHHVPLPALLMALKLALRQVAVWLVYSPLALFSLITLSAWPTSPRFTRRRAWELIMVAIVLMAGSVFGGFFLGTWTMGAVIPLRAVNLVLIFFIIDWMILLAGLGALLRHFNVRIPRLGPALCICAFSILGASALLMKNNVTTAWSDLLSGRAWQYDQESSQRHALIRASAEPDVLVPVLTARPASLFFNDLTTDPANWRNTGCARFFRKRSVALMP